MRVPVFEWLSERWDRYQAQKKSDALYNKLHRYDDKDGKQTKFRQKDAYALGKEALRQKRQKEHPEQFKKKDE